MIDIHDTADLVSKALRRAWQLGQTYWQQADSEYPSQWKKADVTQATFDQLIADTKAAILTSNSSAQNVPKVVAYLDIGAGGYMDIGTDLTDEELDAIPKGRHMLGIVGTYGVEGYVPAQPATIEMSITTGALSEMFLRLDGHDKAQPGYEWRKGWNDAIRQAMDYAQPAPSVPTALLVAVANLVAQMEIVSRVGFVDTPNDKDSCAAFCVAEGTWLELMSAVESLASALAAAPEAKR